MRTSDFDYELPPGLIAQEPLPERDRARMMVLNRSGGGGGIEHRLVRDLPDLLCPEDLLVVNDTRVIPARLFGHKTATGGRVEVLLTEPLAPDRWHALYKTAGRVRAGDACRLASGLLDAVIANVREDGSVVLQFAKPACGMSLMEILEKEGTTPLPPYIRRPLTGGSGKETVDRRRYQTIYARVCGAVAAPTAGLHFTEKLLAEIDKRGIKRAAVTLHVGPGTFRPVKSENMDEHAMESERYRISAETAELIEKTRAGSGRVLAVGSTTVRALEHVAAANNGRVAAAAGRASLFVRPGHRFRVVDMMLTNFHLPRSTLLMMVSALAERERVLAAYRVAVTERYRFYSYGDCMLIR